MWQRGSFVNLTNSPLSRKLIVKKSEYAELMIDQRVIHEQREDVLLALVKVEPYVKIPRAFRD